MKAMRLVDSIRQYRSAGPAGLIPARLRLIDDLIVSRERAVIHNGVVYALVTSEGREPDLVVFDRVKEAESIGLG